MPIEHIRPSVYVAGSPEGPSAISAAATSITAFVGYLRRGPPNEPVQCLSFDDFERTFGGLDAQSPTSFQGSQFFLNGGSEAWVSRLCAAGTPSDSAPEGAPPDGSDVAGDPEAKTGIHALDAIPGVNLICVPDMAQMPQPDYLIAATATLEHALQRRAFALLDIPQDVTTPSEAVNWAQSAPGNFGQGIISAATYFPQIEVPTPFSTVPAILGACGTMAGLYAATDAARGVWKAAAGIAAPIAGVQQLHYVMSDEENGLINPLGLNAIRTFPVYGNVAWGARTLASANPNELDWKYIQVRRLALLIEQSLVNGLQWVAFEANDEQLWSQIRQSVGAFLDQLFAQGAFCGSSPAQACQVICDASTTTPDDMDNGIVNILVQFAPVEPGEFLVISLQLTTGPSAG
jgi:phage tail sheath protein FI